MLQNAMVLWEVKILSPLNIMNRFYRKWIESCTFVEKLSSVFDFYYSWHTLMNSLHLVHETNGDFLPVVSIKQYHSHVVSFAWPFIVCTLFYIKRIMMKCESAWVIQMLWTSWKSANTNLYPIKLSNQHTIGQNLRIDYLLSRVISLN